MIVAFDGGTESDAVLANGGGVVADRRRKRMREVDLRPVAHAGHQLRWSRHGE